jgi:NAD(P)-dependent dehydrogenase (short-subunit alcohol dehydrogenase family)
MKAPFPAPITNWHNDTYSSISPTNPSLSAAGKTIVITGGGTGIGRATVEAFAQAKAASITITGRRLAPLEETKKSVEAKYGVPVHIFSADVVDGDAMRKVAKEVGGWDVFVHNAGYMAEKKTITETDIDDWWKGWEVRHVTSADLVFQADTFRSTSKAPSWSGKASALLQRKTQSSSSPPQLR